MQKAAKKEFIRRVVARHANAAIKLSDAIADLAEPGGQEAESAKLITEFVAARGFKVEHPFRDIPTAFKATRGVGRPLIGMLAEYDALPNCGPNEGEWGHGCGHNLLGAGAALGAVAAADALDARHAPGKVVLWGCPAEELLMGKVYMARDGAFKGNDAILGWHPGGNGVGRLGGSALDSLLFEFFGKTAHGASAHGGRSALDGVVLMDVAANYLREHIPENCRIHMCVRDGGDAPNVVPAYAKVWYFVRGKDRTQVDELRERLVLCAKGAALATETKIKWERLTGCYSRLSNDTLSDALLANFKLFGVTAPTERDKKLVRKLGKKPDYATELSIKPGTQGRGSSDEDNVSWLAPFGRFGVACCCKGTTGHHRDYANQMKFPFAHKAVARAGELFAATVLDLCTNKKQLAKAKAEFRKKTKGFKYDPLVKKRQKPPGPQP